MSARKTSATSSRRQGFLRDRGLSEPRLPGEVTRIDRSPEASQNARAIASSSARPTPICRSSRHARDDPDRDQQPDQRAQWSNAVERNRAGCNARSEARRSSIGRAHDESFGRSNIGQYEKAVRALGDYHRAVEMGLSICFRGASNALMTEEADARRSRWRRGGSASDQGLGGI